MMSRKDIELLHPKYWLTWFGLGVLWLLVQMPYPWIVKLGRFLGTRSRVFLKRRESIARRNLRLCFPNMSDERIEQLIADNFKSLGMGLLETGMGWFWSDSRLRKYFEIDGKDRFLAAQQHHRGVMLVGVHFMSLELCGRIMGLCQPILATYRPHNNALMERVQTWGRSRSLKGMIDRKNLRAVITSLKKEEVVWFAPDQDYGPKGSIFTPFFAVEKAATTKGPLVLSRLSNAVMMTMTLTRKSNNSGYCLHFGTEFKQLPEEEAEASAYVNHAIEAEIMRAPEQYLWVHRRFKTRPIGEPSLYGA